MTARPGRCRRRPIPTSSTTTRTCWRSSASRCRPTPSSTQAQFLDLVKKARAADITPIAPGRRRPALSRRLHPRRGAAAQARHRRLRQAAPRPALLRGSARRRRVHLGQGAGRRRRLSEELHDPEARRVAPLLLPEAGRAHVPHGQLLHRPRLRAGGQGGQAAGLPARHHAVPGDGRAAPATSARRSPSAPASPSMPPASTRISRPPI